jgi:nucleoside-diphosphate-sugar epimerase
MEIQDKILVIGACGQIGVELVPALINKYGGDNVIATDIHAEYPAFANYRCLDALNAKQVENLLEENAVTHIYLLAAMLSGKGELQSEKTWRLNIQSLLTVLTLSDKRGVKRIFWPSSIAVFGPGSPKYNCPQQTRIEPNTVYGISKRAGEYWCNYYFEKFGVDVRSLRFPELISYTGNASGGSTDYAADMFKGALLAGNYECFLSEDNCLPMMYLPDAVRAAIELMDAPKKSLTIRTSYNIAAMSFSPCDLAAEIKKHIPEFSITYQPDFRNAIAYRWPASIKDLQARNDWGWQPQFSLESMTTHMLKNLSATLEKKRNIADDYNYQSKRALLSGVN